MTMTIEQVRDELIKEAEWYESRLGDYKTPDFRAMADAIDFHLSQPQPVVQGEAVAWLDNHGNVYDELVMAQHNCDPGSVPTPLYKSTPTIPTSYRLVPVDEFSDKVERALSELVDKIVPGLDTGDIIADAKAASEAMNGRVLAPLVATREIIESGRKSLIESGKANVTYDTTAAYAYAEMLNAAPTVVGDGKEEANRGHSIRPNCGSERRVRHHDPSQCDG
jgi:hypothetical protein